MRDSKFRIWDKEKNCWFQPTYKAYLREIEELLLTQEGELVLRKYNRMEHESLFPNRFEKVWYTGLKDRNKKEIYEGDIVKSATQNNVIEYQHGSFMVLGLHEDKYERTFSTLYHFLIDATIPNVDGSRFDGVTTNLEVIGNIYEYPHLLEGDS